MKELQFEHQVVNYSTYLKSIAMKLTANKEKANDLLQDTIYRALLNQEKFIGGNLKAWLTTIMRNLFINDIRTAKRRQNIGSSESKDFLIESSAHTVTRNLGDASIMMKEVQAEIDKLHPDLKTPFMMRFHGFKYNEIAQQLNAPIGTIKSRIHIARKNLIRRLSTMYGTKHLAELAA